MHKMKNRCLIVFCISALLLIIGCKNEPEKNDRIIDRTDKAAIGVTDTKEKKVARKAKPGSAREQRVFTNKDLKKYATY